MRYRKLTCVTFLFLTSFCNSGFSAPVNIIDATHGPGVGSFEMGTFDSSTTDGTLGFNHLPTGSTNVTGWTVGNDGDGVDWLAEPQFNAHSGSMSIDLQHTSNGSISTTFPTEIGQAYALSFAAGTVDGFDTEGEVTIASLAGQAFNVTFGSANFASLSYQLFQYTFTANAATSTLTFAGMGVDGTTAGPIIDSVSVSAVPEPSPLLLLFVVVIPMALVGLKRRLCQASPDRRLGRELNTGGH